MLNSEEYAAIKADDDQISRASFAKSYFYPEGMRFAASDALFPGTTLAESIGPEYEAQCKMLCYGPYPSWAEVQTRFLEPLSALMTMFFNGAPGGTIISHYRNRRAQDLTKSRHLTGYGPLGAGR